MTLDDVGYRLGVTHYTAADVAIADRHIMEGEAHIVRQELLISELEMKGWPIDDALDLLGRFQELLLEHRKH